MIYTYLSSKDRETEAETGIFSCCREVSIVFIFESDVFDPGFLPPTPLVPALGQDVGTWLPPAGSSATGFDRKGQCKAGRPTRTPQKNMLGFFSVGQHTAHLGAGGMRLIFGNFLEALLTISRIAEKHLCGVRSENTAGPSSSLERFRMETG